MRNDKFWLHLCVLRYALGILVFFHLQTFAQEPCDLVLETPIFNDLMQYEDSLAAAMGLDGVRRPLIGQTGLCGPVCVVNSVVTRFNLPSSRALMVNELVNDGIIKLIMPHDRILHASYSWEVGRLLKHQLEKLNIDAKIDYLGDTVSSLNPDDFDVAIPLYSEVRPTSDIHLKDLKTANSKRTIMIALYKINTDTPRADITSLSGRGHFVIIEKIVTDPKSKESFAVIRDPEFNKPYWAKLKYFKNDNFKFATFELLPLNQTPESDKIIIPIVSIIRARF